MKTQIALSLILLGSCGSSALPSKWECRAAAAHYEQELFAVSERGSFRATILFNEVNSDEKYWPVGSVYLHDVADGSGKFVRFGIQLGVVPTARDRITVYLNTPGKRKEIGFLPFGAPIPIKMNWDKKALNINTASISTTLGLTGYEIADGSVSCSSAAIDFQNIKLSTKI